MLTLNNIWYIIHVSNGVWHIMLISNYKIETLTIRFYLFMAHCHFIFFKFNFFIHFIFHSNLNSLEIPCLCSHRPSYVTVNDIKIIFLSSLKFGIALQLIIYKKYLLLVLITLIRDLIRDTTLWLGVHPLASALQGLI